MRNWRKWLVLVLIVFLFAGITAHAFSGIGKDHWSSKLEKGEYRGDGNAIEATVDEDYTSPDETYENEKSPHHVFVIVSESQQILVVTPDEPDKKDAGAEIEEPVVEAVEENTVEEIEEYTEDSVIDTESIAVEVGEEE